MRTKLMKYNTLRNQMLVGFLLAMIIILLVVAVVMYDSVGTLLKNHAEKQTKQTAVQASGRLEALIDRIDLFTMQTVTHPQVQSILLEEMNMARATFAQRQELTSVVKDIHAYISGVHSVEIYSGYERLLYPLDGANLNDRVEPVWVETAREAKGKLIWIGIDPNYPDTVLAIRSMSLVDRWFLNGGYLLIRMNLDYFSLDELNDSMLEGSHTLLINQAGKLVVSSYPGITQAEIDEFMSGKDQTVTLGGRDMLIVRQYISEMNWTMMILQPVEAVMEGISVLRTAIIVSAVIGTVLFLILSLFLSTYITRPIFNLIRTMKSSRFGVLKTNPATYSSIEITELNKTYNQMIEHINELIKLVYEKELLQSRTELKALQSQINPHFLFNTLDALYWSLQENGEDELAEQVVSLSELFRYTINRGKNGDWVTLGDELEHIERYLQIMKMRFGDRLSWSVDVPGKFLGVRIPRLLIQPLVENCILHGVGNKLGPGKVSIEACESKGGHIRIDVSDDGPGIPEAVLEEMRERMASGKTWQDDGTSGKGLGIINVHRRLMLYFGKTVPNNAGLVVESDEGQGTRFTLEIPHLKEAASF